LHSTQQVCYRFPRYVSAAPGYLSHARAQQTVPGMMREFLQKSKRILEMIEQPQANRQSERPSFEIEAPIDIPEFHADRRLESLLEDAEPERPVIVRRRVVNCRYAAAHGLKKERQVAVAGADVQHRSLPRQMQHVATVVPKHRGN